MVVLNVTHVPGALTLWPDLIQRRFQPRLNRRLGSVMLLEEYPGVEALETRLAIVNNPYASKPVPPAFISRLEGALRARFP